MDKDGRSWIVRFAIAPIDGRLSLLNLVIEPENAGYGLTQSVLRQLPIAEWERETLSPEATHLVNLAQSGPSKPHAGRRHSDEELRHVANIYMAALNARLPVQRTVAEALGLSLSTATKQIVAARKKGFIPPIKKENDG